MTYTYGQSKTRLVLCPKCREYRPALHPCPGPPPEQGEE